MAAHVPLTSINRIRKNNRRNSLRKQKMSRKMNISIKTLLRLIREVLNMKAYQRSTNHLFTPKLMAIRKERCGYYAGM